MVFSAKNIIRQPYNKPYDYLLYVQTFTISKAHLEHL